MFGTTQRRSVTATGRFRIYECGVPVCLACATDKAAKIKPVERATAYGTMDGTEEPPTSPRVRVFIDWLVEVVAPKL